MGLEGVWKDEGAGVLVRLFEVAMVSDNGLVYSSLCGRVETLEGDWVGDRFGWSSTDAFILTPVLPKRNIKIVLFNGQRCDSGYCWDIRGKVMATIGAFTAGRIPADDILEVINGVGRSLEK